MRLIKDLGMRFPTEKSKSKKRYGLYVCPKCQKEFEAQTSNVKSGSTTKCRKCADNNNSLNLGVKNPNKDWKSRLRRIHKGMIARCKHNPLYTDRNISVCKEWLVSYESFKKWALSNGYKDELSIDRINNDGNYEPSNCRWTTPSTQSRNTRILYSSNSSGYRGVHWSNTYKRYISKIKLEGKFVYLGRFETAIEGAIAYDRFVKINNLEHTINNVLGE